MTTSPQIGEHWAYRPGRVPGNPVIRVEVLQFGPPSSKHKLRVRYLDGEYAGLDEWVPKTRLHVPWDAAEGWDRDERAMAAACAADDEPYNGMTFWAVIYVFEAMEEPPLLDIEFSYRVRGVLEIGDLPAAGELLRLDPHGKPLAFTDRFGVYHAPFGVALEMARRLCQLSPEQVMAVVGRNEARDRQDTVTGRAMGTDFYGPEVCLALYQDHQPRYELVREWCGASAAEAFDRVVALEAEVARLRKVIEDQASHLKFSGHPGLAKQLLRKRDTAEEEALS